jgi:uncharacterized protein DUF6065
MEDRWANRCLPLVVANEAGWVLLNEHAFVAAWSGEPTAAAVTIDFDDDVPTPHPVQSHFGYGIVTWAVPYLFRTPREYNLLARGPANWPKDGIAALEGLVEMDSSVATFTMNWKLTRPDHPVRFEAGEPFCMVVPQRCGELESFRPLMRDLAADPDTKAGTKAWVQSRHDAEVRKFLGEYSREYEDEKTAWHATISRARHLTDASRPATKHVSSSESSSAKVDRNHSRCAARLSRSRSVHAKKSSRARQ